MRNGAPWRRLSERELTILRTLVEDREFPGSERLKEQIDFAEASGFTDNSDNYGSVRLRVPAAGGALPAEVTHRIPVEAEYRDRDGVPVHVLLHVVGGFLAELEVYKADGTDLVVEPDSSLLHVTHQ